MNIWSYISYAVCSLPVITGLLVVLSLAAPANAATCFYTGDQTSGMNKICYYDCLGGTAAITVPAYSLCPLSINR